MWESALVNAILVDLDFGRQLGVANGSGPRLSRSIKLRAVYIMDSNQEKPKGREAIKRLPKNMQQELKQHENQRLELQVLGQFRTEQRLGWEKAGAKAKAPRVGVWQVQFWQDHGFPVPGPSPSSALSLFPLMAFLHSKTPGPKSKTRAKILVSSQRLYLCVGPSFTSSVKQE